MGDQVSVNTDRLGVAIPQVQQLSNRINEIYTGVNDTADGLGECWGGDDDPIGRSFAEGYKPGRDQVNLGLSGTRDVVDSTATGIHTWERGLVQTEENNTIKRPSTPDHPAL
jgi:hypothetical protein